MIQIINRDLFETKTTLKDNTRFPGGTYQLDVYTKGGKDDRRSAPIVRAYFDTELEAKTISATDFSDSDPAGTRLKSIVKTNAKGKEIIQVKITKCSAKNEHYTVLAAIPFRGSISGVISGEKFSLIKGLIKNVDSFKSKATGKTYNKILYLVLNSTEKIDTNADICTVKCDVVSRNEEGLATLKPNQYNVVLKDGELDLEFVPGTPKTGLSDDELHELAPKVQFADLMEICFANADR